MSEIANILFKNSKNTISADVQLINFIETDIHFCYCPQLDITGYGNTEDEAFESFQIVSKEFFNYTTNKDTLVKILMNLVWKIKKGTSKKPKDVVIPTWQNLLQNNSTLEDITKKEFKVRNYSVGIPA
jgi:hypothetical protein